MRGNLLRCAALASNHNDDLRVYELELHDLETATIILRRLPTWVEPRPTIRQRNGETTLYGHICKQQSLGHEGRTGR